MTSTLKYGVWVRVYPPCGLFAYVRFHRPVYDNGLFLFFWQVKDLDIPPFLYIIIIILTPYIQPSSHAYFVHRYWTQTKPATAPEGLEILSSLLRPWRAQQEIYTLRPRPIKLGRAQYRSFKALTKPGGHGRVSSWHLVIKARRLVPLIV